MIESESGPGVPAKPVAPPSIERGLGQETLVSDHPAKTKTVLSSFRRLRFGRMTSAASKSENAVPDPNAELGDAGKSRRKIAWYWVAGSAALLFVAGVVLGTTLPDPKKSGAYVGLQSEKDDVGGQLTSLQGRFDSLAAGIKGREAAITTREVAVDKAGADVKTAEAAVKSAEAAVKTREEAVTGAEKAKAANTISEGTWTVGVDVEPGSYRANENVTSGCYWGIYRTGSNGSDIIDNDIVTGGRPSVVLSAGQDFKSSRCGTWSKQ